MNRRTLSIVCMTTLVVASSIDSILTLHLIDLGASEINPIMAWAIDYSIEFFLVIKFLLVTSCSAVIVLYHECVVFGWVKARYALVILSMGYLALISYEAVLLTV